MIAHFLITNIICNIEKIIEPIFVIGQREPYYVHVNTKMEATIELESISKLDIKIIDNLNIQGIWLPIKEVAIYRNSSREEVDGYLSLVVLPDGEIIQINKNLIVLNSIFYIRELTELAENENLKLRMSIFPSELYRDWILEIIEKFSRKLSSPQTYFAIKLCR